MYKTLIKKLVILQQQINAFKNSLFGSVGLPLYIDNTNQLLLPEADTNNDGYLSASDHDKFSNMWSKDGNTATPANFLGTTDASDLIFKTNGSLVGKITGDSNFNYLFSPNNVGIGTGSYNFIFGYQGTMSGTARYNLIGGFQNTIGANVLAGVAIGRNTVVNYNYGMAVNSSSIANGQSAFAANNCQVNSNGGAGFGINNEIATDASLPTAINANNRIFVIGNGSATNHRHNALTVLHGSDVTDGTKPLFGFNTLAPASTLEVGGSFGTKYVAKTADYTLTELDATVHFTSGTSTATLPTAVGCTGRIYVLKNTSGNNLTLATTSSQTIDGSAPGVLATGAVGQLQSDGANWIKIN